MQIETTKWIRTGLIAFTSFLLFSFVIGETFALEIRVFEKGKKPNDVRLNPPKDLNGYFPFKVPQSKEAWEARRKNLRLQLKVAMGIHPLPTKFPLNAKIHGKITKPDYTIEKVFFESMPGFYVTGNLYRPKNVTGKIPAILCPHGHWANGRFYDAGDAAAKREIDTKAEKLDAASHSPLQARCVHLARMGCAVFHYDMIGYADSIQITYDLAHRFAKQRPEMNSEKNWGLFSPQAESHLQSVMGLQTYNSIRAVDFMLSLPEVDANRIGVTGASGGGTQTMILAAIDDRIAASFPAVMVSTAMQGGCTCENCSLLRVNTGNVEFAAMFAPKPQGMTAANDWTKEMSTKGFPEIKRLYEMYDAGDKVSLVDRTEFNHNFNMHSRLGMYELMSKTFELKSKFSELPFDRLTTSEMTVWDKQHPKPKSGDPNFEKSLLASWHADSKKQIESDQSKAVEGIRAIIGRQNSKNDKLTWKLIEKKDCGDFIRMSGTLTNETHGEQLPMLFFYPKASKDEMLLWTSESGKRQLVNENDEPVGFVRGLMGKGITVAGVDLFGQGEFLDNGSSISKTRRVANPREAAAYTFGFNHALPANRVHDILSVVAFAKNFELHRAKKIYLFSEDRTTCLTTMAAIINKHEIDANFIRGNRFKFASVDEIHSPWFLPGGSKYYDLLDLSKFANMVSTTNRNEVISAMKQ